MQKLLLIFRICWKRFTEAIIAEGNEDKGGAPEASLLSFFTKRYFP
jgi:hypothetical protein